MPLEIDNFAALQKLREAALAQQDKNYTPGTIPITEVAAANNVSVRTMVAAFKTGGHRKIDDLSLLTPINADVAGLLLRQLRELKNPLFSQRRRDGFVPVTELSLQLGIDLDDLLEVCIQVGFSAGIARSDLWLDKYEQDLVRSWVEDSRFQSDETSTSLRPRMETSPVPAPTDAIHAPAVKILLEGLQEPHFMAPTVRASGAKRLPAIATGTAAAQQSGRRGKALVPPNDFVARENSEGSIKRDIGDISSQNLNRLLGDREVPPTPEVLAFKTSIGQSAVEVRELQRTLDLFCPSSYGDFFYQMRAALRVDASIQRSMSSKDARQEHWTATAHSKFIKDICNYSYGIFAYADVGARLGTTARKSAPQTQKSQTTSLYKFRPMYKGLLTDASRRQFILWRVGEGIPDLLVIKWDALSGWLDGMERGHYVGLRARHIRVVNSLNSEDQDVVRLMVAMADNLRAGTRRTTPRPVETASKGRTQLVGQRAAAPRSLGYKPQNDWLVPITVQGRDVSTGLDSNFFTEYGGKRAHQVRSFYRREPGSPLTAPRTVLVQGHVRGGQLFEDARLLPAVTIRRK